MRKILSSVLLFFCFTLLFAQHDTSELSAFNEAKNSVVCLQNKHTAIPIKSLVDKRVFLLTDGVEYDGVFGATLNKYLPIQPLPKETKADDVLIYAVKPSKAGNNFIASYLEGKKGVKVLFLMGAVSSLNLDEIATLYDVILYAPSDSDWHQSIAAQLIFGGMGSVAILKDRINPLYWKGEGVATITSHRFAYVPPVVMGMDAQLLEDSIRAIVMEGMEAGAFPGAQVLVAKDGKIVYHKAFGYHTYDSLQAVQLDDIYDFASITKVTSALPALMKWYGEGQFKLNEPLKKYFPSFANSNKGDLIFRSMLAHNARLRPWIPYWRSTLKGCAKYPWKKGWDNDNYNNGNFKRHTFKRDSSKKYSVFVTDDLWLHNDYKQKSIYKTIKKSPLRDKQEYKYSGLLFYLLPELVANKSGMDFEKYLKKTFYEPLGATTITYNPSRFYSLKRIIPTERDTFFRRVQIHGYVHDEGAAMMGGVSGNAGLFGSIGDLAKLMQMYLNGGTFGDKRYISKAAVQEFSSCQYCIEGNKRGLGFDKPLIEYNAAKSSIAKDASPSSFGHSGYTGTFTWVDPDNGLLYIFFCNRVYPTRANRKIYTMNIRPRIHQVLYDAIEE